MWVLKIKSREKWNIFNSRTTKYKIKLYFHSHNFYEEKGKYFFIASGIVDGDMSNVKRFLTSLKKEKKVSFFERDGNFFVCIYSEKKISKRVEAVKVVYNPKLIFLKPVVIDEKGWEEWEVASTKRKDLEDFINYSEKLGVEHELIYLKKQKISNVMIYSFVPKLTEKQRKAFVLAVENNYYGYPRKTTLKKLAKMMGISLSTYQFHLANAEKKLLPYFKKHI